MAKHDHARDRDGFLSSQRRRFAQERRQIRQPFAYFCFPVRERWMFALLEDP
jgi:hypothetical protein